MIYGMYLSTMGAMSQSARHGTIANNLANANTTGYKPDWTVFRAVDAESVLKNSQREGLDQILEKTGGGVWVDETVSNFKVGALQETGNPLDMALDDSDDPRYRRFFTIRKEADGEMHYTRDGSFRVRGDGRLVTISGAEVTSINGDPIDIPVGARVHVAKDGTLFDQNDAEIAQVGVVRTADFGRLQKIGENLYIAEDGAQLEPAPSGVMGGHVEGSAVEPVFEMVDMVEAHRTYETNMTFLRIQDETLGDSVRRISATV